MVANFPESFIQGDSLKFEVSNSDFKASEDWSLSYELVGATSTITITSTVDGDGFKIDVSSTTTAGYATGLYTVYEIFSNLDGSRNTNEVSQTTILLNPVGATASDQRTHNQRTLDAIEAVIEGRATVDQESYSIAGRSLTRMSIGDLMKFRDRYREYVLREQGNKFVGRKILPRFTR